MKTFIKYPSIEQFRHTVAGIQKGCRYTINADNGLLDYTPNAKPPTITFNGTVKLHGTNAAICCKYQNENFWVQSRKRILTVQNDNYGFARYCAENEDNIQRMLLSLAYCCDDYFGNTLDGYVISVYGEWCGEGIQSGIGISELNRMFVVFSVRLTKTVNEKIIDQKWLPLDSISLTEFSDELGDIHLITDFPTYTIDIDFSDPSKSTDELISLTEQVEADCPVANHFGIHDGIGEGIVWEAFWQNSRHTFKTKGEKHANAKSPHKIKVPISPEQIEQTNDLINYVVTDSRLNQGYAELFANTEADIAETGKFIKWMINDIAKEEMDVIIKSNLEFRSITKGIGKAAVKWFHKKIGDV